MPILEITKGTHAGKMLRLKKGKETTFGRGEMTIQLDDEHLSRKHARIFEHNNRWYLADIGSMNGTYLNGKRIEDPVKLREGDQIRIGHTVMVVRGGSSSKRDKLKPPTKHKADAKTKPDDTEKTKPEEKPKDEPGDEPADAPQPEDDKKKAPAEDVVEEEEAVEETEEEVVLAPDESYTDGFDELEDEVAGIIDEDGSEGSSLLELDLLDDLDLGDADLGDDDDDDIDDYIPDYDPDDPATHRAKKKSGDEKTTVQNKQDQETVDEDADDDDGDD